MTLFSSALDSVRLLLLQLQRRLKRQTRVRCVSRRTMRRLRTESLESRQLLAADLQPFHHNHFDAEDVNDDGIISPIDALMVVNSMNQSTAVDTNGFVDVNNDGLRSPIDVLLVVNRINRGGERTPRQAPSRGNPVPETPTEVRSIDGTGNNLANPEQGSTGEALLRVADADYADGVLTPAGEDRPSAREISNVLSAADASTARNDRDLSAFVYVWGQFIDHDIDLTQNQIDGELFNIEVPTGDPQFDPAGTGEAVIPLVRSQFDADTGTSVANPRQQISDITAYVDGSMVYGSDQATAASLRSFEGGRLLITDAGLLPTDVAGNIMAGDIRADENISLTSLQTLFVREHNRLADEISASKIGLSDETIYQQARAVVIAEIQAITYSEFLPALLGRNAISRYTGYDSSVDPTIANEFSTAAFRFGHSTLNDDVEFFGNDGRAVREGIPLFEAFHNAGLLGETGIDSILKYDSSSLAQEIDLQMVDSLRNALFGPPGSGGLDLAALNIQRGREHGLADYNSTRAAYGLARVESFADIASDVDLQGKLESLYGDVNNIDLWVGLLAEEHLPGSSVGELTQTIIVDQFERIRDGDRFWYENVFSGRELRTLQATSLADVIERNTNVSGLQDNVFFMRAEVSGQVLGLARPAASPPTGPAANASRNRPTGLPGVEGVTVELLNDEGAVIDTTLTDRNGNYRFSSFDETGDYHIHLADGNAVAVGSSETLDILIPNGSTRLRGLNFSVVLS